MGGAPPHTRLMTHTLYLVSAKQSLEDVAAIRKEGRLLEKRAHEWFERNFDAETADDEIAAEMRATLEHHLKVAEKMQLHKAISYWKVGITKWANPLRRDRKRYQEVFRSVCLPSQWDAARIEKRIRDSFKSVDCPIGFEALNGLASLESVLALFDECVARYQAASKLKNWNNQASLPVDEKRIAELSAAIAESINEAKAALVERKEPVPMWA